MPKVSVVMAVYNGGAYLGDAIQSILSQSFTYFEFIIIDDGSTDNSAEIICSYGDPRIRLLQQENRGLPASLNRGINLGRGEYIARMDADDIALPNRLECQVTYLNAHPEYILVGTRGFLVDKDDRPIRILVMPQEHKTIQKSLDQCASPFIHGSVMFRKLTAVQCGLYDDKMATGQDWFLWTKMIQVGKMTNLAEVLYRRRLTPQAITNMTPHMLKLKMTILRRTLKTGLLTAEDAEKLRFFEKPVISRQRLALYHLAVGKQLTDRVWRPVVACRHILRSLHFYPWNPKSWLNLSFCFLPRSLVSAWRRRRGHGYPSF